MAFSRWPISSPIPALRRRQSTSPQALLLAGSQDSATNNLRSTGHDAVSLSTLNDTPTWQLVTVPPSRCIAGHARPLHAWLPDAMAGSTPISALIHAAAVVAAHGPAVLE